MSRVCNRGECNGSEEKTRKPIPEIRDSKLLLRNWTIVCFDCFLQANRGVTMRDTESTFPALLRSLDATRHRAEHPEQSLTSSPRGIETKKE